MEVAFDILWRCFGTNGHPGPVHIPCDVPGQQSPPAGTTGGHAQPATGKLTFLLFINSLKPFKKTKGETLSQTDNHVFLEISRYHKHKPQKRKGQTNPNQRTNPFQTNVFVQICCFAPCDSAASSASARPNVWCPAVPCRASHGSSNDGTSTWKPKVWPDISGYGSESNSPRGGGLGVPLNSYISYIY